MSNIAAQTELREWLASIALPECADALLGADIDLDVARDLTDNDLRELGLSLGQRKRLIRAITDLNQEERRAADP